MRSSGRTQRFIVGGGGTPPDRPLDRLALYLPNGDLLDLGNLEASGGGGFKGIWQPDTDYSAGSIVGVLTDNPEDDADHRVWTFATDVDIPAGVTTPGVNITQSVFSGGPGGAAPTADYNRIQPGPQSYDYVDGFAYFFFDLAAGGTIDLSSTVFQQVPVLYNQAGESIWSGGLSIPVHETDVPPGTYFVALQNGQGGDGTETVTLTLSAGAAIPDPDVFWYSLG